MDFQPSDFVQIRRGAESEPVEIAEGVIAVISGTVYTLGTREYDTGQGWSVELISRPLQLPQTLCWIDATLTAGEQVRLMGQGDVWMTAEGRQVPAEQIQTFTEAS